MIQYPIICVQAEGSGFFYFSIHNMNIYKSTYIILLVIQNLVIFLDELPTRFFTRRPLLGWKRPKTEKA